MVRGAGAPPAVSRAREPRPLSPWPAPAPSHNPVLCTPRAERRGSAVGTDRPAGHLSCVRFLTHRNHRRREPGAAASAPFPRVVRTDGPHDAAETRCPLSRTAAVEEASVSARPRGGEMRVLTWAGLGTGESGLPLHRGHPTCLCVYTGLGQSPASGSAALSGRSRVRRTPARQGLRSFP